MTDKRLRIDALKTLGEIGGIALIVPQLLIGLLLLAIVGAIAFLGLYMGAAFWCWLVWWEMGLCQML